MCWRMQQRKKRKKNVLWDPTQSTTYRGVIMEMGGRFSTTVIKETEYSNQSYDPKTDDTSLPATFLHVKTVLYQYSTSQQILNPFLVQIFIFSKSGGTSKQIRVITTTNHNHFYTSVLVHKCNTLLLSWLLWLANITHTISFHVPRQVGRLSYCLLYCLEKQSNLGV